MRRGPGPPRRTLMGLLGEAPRPVLLMFLLGLRQTSLGVPPSHRGPFCEGFRSDRLLHVHVLGRLYLSWSSFRVPRNSRRRRMRSPWPWSLWCLVRGRMSLRRWSSSTSVVTTALRRTGSPFAEPSLMISLSASPGSRTSSLSWDLLRLRRPSSPCAGADGAACSWRRLGPSGSGCWSV